MARLPRQVASCVRLALISVLFTLALLPSFVAAGPEAAGAKTTATPTPRPVFFHVGDSLTEGGGWVAPAVGWELLLREEYLRSVDVLNRGLSGYNTRVFRKYALPGIVEELTTRVSPALVTVWFGVNDAALEGGPNVAQHVPLDEYRENLVAIITTLRAAAPGAKLLLVSPAYIDDDQRRKHIKHTDDPLDRSNDATALYAAACVKVAKAVEKQGVAFLDLFDHFMTKYAGDADRAAMLRDGVHFTDKGNRVVFSLLKQQIEKLLPAEIITKSQFPELPIVLKWDKQDRDAALPKGDHGPTRAP